MIIEGLRGHIVGDSVLFRSFLVLSGALSIYYAVRRTLGPLTFLVTDSSVRCSYFLRPSKTFRRFALRRVPNDLIQFLNGEIAFVDVDGDVTFRVSRTLTD